MNLSLILEPHGPLELHPAYPPDYRGVVLAGSTPYWGKGTFGSLLIQELVQEQFRIRYIVLQTLQKLILHWREEKTLKMQVALQNEWRYQGPEKGIIRLPPSCYHLIWAPEKQASAYFEKGREYRIFTAHFMPPLVQQLIPRFPEAAVPSEKQVLPLEPRLNELMQAVLVNPYNDTWRQFFYENKIRELLFSLLAGRPYGSGQHGYSEEEVRRAHQVDMLILSDLTKHYTIKQLAKKMHMSQERLKEVFKAVTGMGLFERLKEARLQKAREILLTTDLPSKAIHELVGYESITGFIDAFKERFGLPPVQYRKRYQPKG